MGKAIWESGVVEKPSKKKPEYLSDAYKKALNRPVSEDLRQEFGLGEGDTIADAIAGNVVLKAMGKITDDKICFVAIKELRETTEGKTPEKLIAAGSNSELAELARVMQGEPAPPDDNLADDVATESSEAEFHKDPNEE